MRRLILLLVLPLLCHSPAFADTEFTDSVPLDLVKAFLGTNPEGSTFIYSDVMDAFPDLPIPAEFDVFGSIDRAYGLMAVYTTALDEDAAREALTGVLLNAGYTEFEVPGSRGTGRGFVPPTQPSPPLNTRMCHDAEGFMSLSFTTGATANIVSLSNSQMRDRRSCAEQLEEQTLAMSRAGAMRSGINQYV